MPRDGGHLVRHVADEVQRRSAHEILVVLLVFIEPLAAIVLREFRKEGKGLFGEVTVGRDVSCARCWKLDEILTIVDRDCCWENATTLGLQCRYRLALHFSCLNQSTS
jgi:hypothetical protein